MGERERGEEDDGRWGPRTRVNDGGRFD